MKCNSVKAEHVRVGDHIFNNHGYCDRAKWSRVKSVTVSGKRVMIKSVSFETTKSVGEGVAVMREDWSK